MEGRTGVLLLPLHLTPFEKWEEPLTIPPDASHRDCSSNSEVLGRCCSLTFPISEQDSNAHHVAGLGVLRCSQWVSES